MKIECTKKEFNTLMDQLCEAHIDECPLENFYKQSKYGCPKDVPVENTRYGEELDCVFCVKRFFDVTITD